MGTSRMNIEAPISDRLSRIEALTGSMAEDISDIKRELHNVSDNAFPRTEANARSAEYDRRMLELTHAIAERLEVKQYQIAHDALIQRLTQLETSPQRQVAWYAVAISGSIGCLSLVLMVIGGLISVTSLILSLLR